MYSEQEQFETLSMASIWTKTNKKDSYRVFSFCPLINNRIKSIKTPQELIWVDLAAFCGIVVLLHLGNKRLLKRLKMPLKSILRFLNVFVFGLYLGNDRANIVHINF